jgi:DNA-binding IclR family transcriptional regulator
MYSTFTRGLELLETIDVYGPLTVTELARLTGADKPSVSRMLSACEPAGWIVRENGRVSLGPRAALLAHFSPGADLIRRAEPLVEAVSGVTGTLVQVYALVGKRAVVVASAGGHGGNRIPVGLGTSTALVATAGGHVVAAQLDDAELGRLLPPEPYPDPLLELMRTPGFRSFATDTFGPGRPEMPEPRRLVTTRRELEERLEKIRAERIAIDRGDVHPELCCIAVPWPHGVAPAAFVCMGTPDEMDELEPLARAVLPAATAPGARREDVFGAAAAFGAAR